MSERPMLYPQLLPGQRVQLCDPTLQAFYGVYGTVVEVRACGAAYEAAHISVRMDDVPEGEALAVFYPHQLCPVSVEAHQAVA